MVDSHSKLKFTFDIRSLNEVQAQFDLLEITLFSKQHVSNSTEAFSFIQQ